MSSLDWTTLRPAKSIRMKKINKTSKELVSENIFDFKNQSFVLKISEYIQVVFMKSLNLTDIKWDTRRSFNVNKSFLRITLRIFNTFLLLA